MRTMRGLITQVRRREGRIGRVWRRISRSTPLMLMQFGASSERDLTHGATARTGKKGEDKSQSDSVTQ